MASEAVAKVLEFPAALAALNVLTTYCAFRSVFAASALLKIPVMELIESPARVPITAITTRSSTRLKARTDDFMATMVILANPRDFATKILAESGHNFT